MLLLCRQDWALRTPGRLCTGGQTAAFGNRTPTGKGNGTMAERDSQAQRIVDRHMWLSMGIGLLPVPLLDIAGVTAVQLRMLQQLAKLYGVPFSRHLGKELVG